MSKIKEEMDEKKKRSAIPEFKIILTTKFHWKPNDESSKLCQSETSPDLFSLGVFSFFFTFNPLSLPCIVSSLRVSALERCETGPVIAAVLQPRVTAIPGLCVISGWLFVSYWL